VNRKRGGGTDWAMTAETFGFLPLSEERDLVWAVSVKIGPKTAAKAYAGTVELSNRTRLPLQFLAGSPGREKPIKKK